MGKRRGAQDPIYLTHKRFYSDVASDQDLILVENVTEYSEKHVQDELGSAFALTSVKIDPRIFGMGVARARIYIIAIRKSKLQWRKGFSIKDFLDSLTSRMILSASSYFWKKLPSQRLSESDESQPRFNPVL